MVNYTYASITIFIDGLEVSFYLFSTKATNNMKLAAHMAGTLFACCCCCLHIKSRSDLYSVLSNIRTGPTDANAFRGHRLTTQKGYTYRKEIKGPRKVNTHAIIGKEKKKKPEKGDR